MSILTITYHARCKDCKFLKEVYKGKRKMHECGNKFAKTFGDTRALRDLVCEEWEFIYN